VMVRENNDTRLKRKITALQAELAILNDDYLGKNTILIQHCLSSNYFLSLFY